MNRVKYLIVPVISLFLAVSFSYADVAGKTDTGIQAIAEPVLDGILSGLATTNYEKYTKDFDTMLKGMVSEAKFAEISRQINGSIGKHQSRKYLGFLNKEGMTVVLWKAKFDNTNDDVLIKLVIFKKEDECFVSGVWFQ